MAFNGKSEVFGFPSYHEERKLVKSSKKNKSELLKAEQWQKKVECVNDMIKKQREQEVSIFICNLDDEVDEAWLYDEFKQFGSVKITKIAMEDGKSKGFGFVKFSSLQEAKSAIRANQGKLLGNKNLHIEVTRKDRERLGLQDDKECLGLKDDKVPPLAFRTPFWCRNTNKLFKV